MSGVIYGAIVVMWLAFLVPMWLKRHDQAPEPKPVERATMAMRVLSRRTHAVADGESAATAGASPMDDYGRFDDSDVAANGSMSRTNRTMGRLVHLTRRAASTGAPRPVSAAERRRRILGGLFALTVVLVVVAGLGRLPWLAVVPAVALLVGYVTLLTVHGRRAARSGRRPQVAASAETFAAVGASHLDVPAATAYTEDETNTFGAVGSAPAGQFIEDELIPHSVSTAAPDGFAGPRLGWDPVPVPSRPTSSHPARPAPYAASTSPVRAPGPRAASSPTQRLPQPPLWPDRASAKTTASWPAARSGTESRFVRGPARRRFGSSAAQGRVDDGPGGCGAVR